jgi:hypothetical protein
LHHVVLFRWRPDTTDAQVTAVTAALTGFAAEMTQVRSYACGPDLRLGEGTWDYGIVATFDDADGWAAYDTDARHIEIRRDLMGPLIAERAAVRIDG